MYIFNFLDSIILDEDFYYITRHHTNRVYCKTLIVIEMLSPIFNKRFISIPILKAFLFVLYVNTYYYYALSVTER